MDCFLCSTSFPAVENILKHLRIEHGAPSISNYKCTACKPATIFKDVHRFKRHIQTRHRTLFEVDSTSSSTSSNIHQEEAKHAPISRSEFEDNVDQNKPAAQEGSDSGFIHKEKDVNVKTLESKEEKILDIRNKLRETFLSFTINLHSKKNLSRKDVVELQQSITEEIVTPILDALSTVTDIPGDPMHAELINDLRDPFDFICTPQRLNTQLEHLSMREAPQVIQYDDEDGNVVSKGCLTPIKFQLKTFFETGSIFQQTMQNMTRLDQSNEISNVVNGSLWKTIKPLYEEKIVLPYFLYSDEAELNDAIGAHSGTHKVCGLYYNLPTIPSHFLSRLSCIFVAGFIKASDISERGPSKALCDLVDIMVELEQKGIELTVEDEKIKVYFVLMGILGDNLGMNLLMGYVTSFNSLLYCRFCKLNKEECQKTIILDCKLNRTKESYTSDLSLSVRESGIKEECGFNRLQYYHAGEFVAVDVMHDFFSHGICAYDLSYVFEYMISTLNISLNAINYRIQKFNFGSTEKQKTYKTITQKQIKSSAFKMTAYEMMILIRYFPLIFGDMIPHNDRVWNFMMTLVELADFVVLPSFNFEILGVLEEQIIYHHTLYRKLFGATLKPKFHILLHYVDTIKKIGPPRYTWSFRFEAMHQIFKQYSRNITSRKNICLTLCIKAHMYFMQNMEDFSKELQSISFKSAVRMKILELPYFNLLSSAENLTTPELYSCKTVTYKGTEYKIGYFVTISEQNLRIVKLFEIKDLLVFDNQLFLTCQPWYVGSYSYHYASIEVQESQSDYEIIDVTLFDGPPVNVYSMDTKKFIRLKKFFV